MQGHRRLVSGMVVALLLVGPASFVAAWSGDGHDPSLTEAGPSVPPSASTPADEARVVKTEIITETLLVGLGDPRGTGPLETRDDDGERIRHELPVGAKATGLEVTLRWDGMDTLTFRIVRPDGTSAAADHADDGAPVTLRISDANELVAGMNRIEVWGDASVATDYTVEWTVVYLDPTPFA